MKIFWKNSIILILFLFLFLFKDTIYSFFWVKEVDFNYLKENELEYYKNEYQKLIKDYDLDFELENKYIYSKIIYRNIYDFYETLVILKGEKDGVKKGDAVVSKDGFIGVVDKVDKNSSYVNLLYNKDLKVSVKVGQNYGMLESKNKKLIINNITKDAEIFEGDTVYTSGLTDIVGNLKIGTVKKISSTKDGLEKEIEVKEISDSKELDYVLIVSLRRES